MTTEVASSSMNQSLPLCNRCYKPISEVTLSPWVSLVHFDHIVANWVTYLPYRTPLPALLLGGGDWEDSGRLQDHWSLLRISMMLKWVESDHIDS